MTKFNRLNNGVASRQRRVVSKHREDKGILPTDIITRHSGSGPIVGDVSYDKGQLNVSHNNVYNNPSVDNSRVAIAQQGAPFIGDLPDIEQPSAWWPSDSPGDSLILPDTFDPDTDEFPTLPEGYFYARLDRGCEPCGLFAWDAGLEDSYWGAQSFVKPSSASLLRAFLSDLGSKSDAPATLELWFDQPIQYSVLQVTEFIKLLVIRSSFGTPVVPLSITVSDSKATVGLDRAVDLREEIYVQVRRGLLNDNSTSPFLSTSGKGKRYEYVICFNRSHVESDIAEGDGVILTTPNRVYDTGGNWMWVFDTFPLLAGDPPDSPTIKVQSVLVVGGDALPGSTTGIKKLATLVESLATYIHLPRRHIGEAVISAGAVTAINNIFLGQRYLAASPTVTLVGGGGTGATATAALVPFAGSVEAVKVTTCGEYEGVNPNHPIVEFEDAPPGGVRATGVAVMYGKKLIAVKITNRGRGYTTTPTITFIGGTPVITPAVVEVLMTTDGIEVTLGNGGSGYTTPPTIRIDPVALAPSMFLEGYLFGPDGIGIGTGSADPILDAEFGSQLLLVNDSRSLVAHTVVAEQKDRVLVTEYEEVFLRLDDEDIDARGCARAFAIGGVVAG